jgi:methionyl-tRNA synthetase
VSRFYITTPIYYVNDVPHIGHAYTTIAADVLARYHRWRGLDVFFLTGTDEHGASVAQAAAAHGQSPQEYCDRISAAFKQAWQQLAISNDYFIRTTDARHEAGVKAFLERLYARGDIYRGRYEGWYCVGCERFYAEDELEDGRLCPLHRREAVWYAEDNYFFRLSRYQEPLLRAVEDPSDPNHFGISPPTRRNEVIGKLRSGLSDISISRASLAWGIPLPFDPAQTTYVWIDALLNYITAIGYHDDQATFERYWPADLHLMAKDILWFHAIIWPALLMAVGLRPPRRVYAHGFFTVEGQKMSKSLGNVIRPAEVVERFGADATRYLVLAAFPFGTDGDISIGSMTERYNADLANDLGNLVNRTVSMVNRYLDGRVPEPRAQHESDRALANAAKGMFAQVDAALANLAFSEAIAAVGAVVSRANRYVEEQAPWSLARVDRERLATVLYTLLETIRLAAHALAPIMPGATARIAEQIGARLDAQQTWEAATAWGGLRPGAQVVAQPTPLFPKIELKPDGEPR